MHQVHLEDQRDLEVQTDGGWALGQLGYADWMGKGVDLEVQTDGGWALGQLGYADRMGKGVDLEVQTCDFVHHFLLKH